MNRDKIRYRAYPNTATTFLEIKHKSNTGQTVKDRILRENETLELDEESLQFLSQGVSAINPNDLMLSARVDYRRIQFISKEQNERFSIDPRVNKDESDQMVTAMKKRGVDVEYMVKDNEGHGFHNEENRFEFYRAMEGFLAKHL